MSVLTDFCVQIVSVISEISLGSFMSCDRVAEHEQVSSVRGALSSAFQDDNGEKIKMCVYESFMLASFYCQIL